MVNAKTTIATQNVHLYEKSWVSDDFESQTHQAIFPAALLLEYQGAHSPLYTPATVMLPLLHIPWLGLIICLLQFEQSFIPGL